MRRSGGTRRAQRGPSSSAAAAIHDPALKRRTPSAASSDAGGSPGRAMTFSGSRDGRGDRADLGGVLTPGTKMPSAPAAR